MKVIHSVVKEKQPLELVEDSPQQNYQFVSMDQDISLTGANRRRIADIPAGQVDQSEGSELKDSQKINSRFGLSSDIQTVAQLGQQASQRDKSIVIDQQENLNGQILNQQVPLTSGGRSDGAEFKGLREDSDAKMLTITHTPKINNDKSDTQMEKKNMDMPNNSQPSMNRTQDAFKHKEKKLLEMFEDQKPQAIDNQQIVSGQE